jgi:hypothetical protein
MQQGQIPAKTEENGQITKKLAQNPRKIVEIGLFPLTLSGPKPHCNHRWGYQEPA